jgi:hypothetical protein
MTRAPKGKWGVAGVPHKGWEWVDVHDLGDERGTCEMCEEQEIRFEHVMCHPDYPHDLRCGCVCAGHMSGNLAGARRREREAKSEARRRAKFPDRRGWRCSDSGNEVIRVAGHLVVVFDRGDRFKFMVKRQPRWPGDEGTPTWSRHSFATELEAKLAAYDWLVGCGLKP